MSRYSPLSLILWALTLGGMAVIAFRIRRPKSESLRCLRIYLITEALFSAAGLACVIWGSPWAYYREYLVWRFASAAAQGILLWGVWRSFYPCLKPSKLRYGVGAIVVLTAVYSALDFSRSIPLTELREMVLITHVIGYTFCFGVALLVAIAWVKGCAWEPVAARIALGYALTIGVSFCAEQMEAMIGYRHITLMHLPALSYLCALLIWNSARSPEQPQPFTPEEIARLEASLADLPRGIPCTRYS